MIASDAVGILQTAGAVTIDGRPALPQSTVFPGDNIRTGDSARAVVTTRGMMISLAPNSSLRIDTGKLGLDSGAVVVSGGNVAVSVNGTRIATSGESSSKFLVQRVNDDLKVVALKGDLTIGDGPQPTTVPATKGVDIPPQAGTSGGSTAARMSWMSNSDLGILIVVAAGIVAGVTLGVVNSQNGKSSSPSIP
jgi:hypothetical protein